ncbi:MAG: cytochrome c biogenesis protein CcdA [Methanobacteriota archaeon]
MSLDVLVVAGSGLLAGVSACALPLYPVLLNQMTKAREDPRLISIFFALGLAGTYFTMYAAAGAISTILGFEFIGQVELFRGRLYLLAAFLCWFMAGRTFIFKKFGGVFQVVKKPSLKGYLGAVATGFAFGTVITPCNAGLLISGILPAIASASTVFQGLILLAIFSFTLSFPVLVLGFASGVAINTFSFLRKNQRFIEEVSAFFLILVGVYFASLYLLI